MVTIKKEKVTRFTEHIHKLESMGTVGGNLKLCSLCEK